MTPSEQPPVCSKCQTPMVRYNVPHTGDKEQAWRLACSCKHSAARRHRGCGPDCTLPAGHLGDHSPVEPSAPIGYTADLIRAIENSAFQRRFDRNVADTLQQAADEIRRLSTGVVRCEHETGPWPAGQKWPNCLKCEIERLRPMAESWQSYEAAQDRKGSRVETSAQLYAVYKRSLEKHDDESTPTPDSDWCLVRLAVEPRETSPDDTEDMASIGRALMGRLPKDYHWSDCPTEIVTDLQNEIHDLCALLTEGVKVWCDSPLPGQPYPQYACGKCWTCRVRAALAPGDSERLSDKPHTVGFCVRCGGVYHSADDRDALNGDHAARGKSS
jgi:hypothetical protein